MSGHGSLRRRLYQTLLLVYNPSLEAYRAIWKHKLQDFRTGANCQVCEYNSSLLMGKAVAELTITVINPLETVARHFHP